MAQFFNFKEDYFGLTDKEVEKNTELYGLNVYTKKEKPQECFNPGKVIFSPAVLLMFLAGILSFFSSGILTGIMIILMDAAYCILSVWIGRSSDQKLSDIRESTLMKFRVIRHGKLELIEKECIVPEDIIVVQAGECVPADALIQECRDLTVDESIFTGSNKPAAKYAGGISKSELKPTFVYSGTKILTGVAVCKVSATGVDTKYYHKIGEVPPKHRYYTTMERIIQKLLPLCSATAAVLALISMIAWMLYGNEVFESAMRGITLGLCFLPTGLDTIIRIYYTRCASEMSAKSALVKSLSDIEKLNSMSVLCVEKEGAISKSRLEVQTIYTPSEELMFKIAALACDPETTDEAERALMVRAAFFDEKITDVYQKYHFIERIPDSNDFMSGALWEVGGSRLYCIKGTPEQILPLCRFHGEELYVAQKMKKEYYSHGWQVMAVACADAEQKDCDETAGFSYTFVGFAAFSSPLRESVPAAVKTCQRAGVRVVMFTEDNAESAAATGRMIGLSGKVVTGKSISQSVKYGSELELDADVYAKVTPEQKLYIIEQLRKKGEIVAMTGTRAEDAEAMEKADIGITISENTTGSAFEAADVIMHDDNFSAIAGMIASARQVHRNIKRACAVMISGYLALILLNMLNLFGDAQLMLNPAIIAVLTMFILPMAALAGLSNRTDMKGKMPPSEFITSRRINYRFIILAAVVGVLCGGVSIASYMFMYNGSNVDFARSCALLSFGFCTTLFTFINLSSGNPFIGISSAGKSAVVGVLAPAVISLILVFVPGLNSIFGMTGIDMLATFISIVTGIIPPLGYVVVRSITRFE
ncbi:MAG: cation-transporting P-type ATPase [Oscillospiraceae bacterium]|nr:cation-transporting P-type ATPase [Oscillospiraceae bacterium]